MTKTSLLTVRHSPWSEQAGGPCGSVGSRTGLHHLHHDARGPGGSPLWGLSSRTSASLLTTFSLGVPEALLITSDTHQVFWLL